MTIGSSRLGTCLVATALTGAIGCTAYEPPELSSNREAPTFEEFVDSLYQEPESGQYIVDWDVPMSSEEHLREAYYRLYGGGELTVHQSGGVDAVWSDEQKLQLSYCISDSFGARKQLVVDAMTTATDGWMAAANVAFVYVPEEDANCTNQNENVLFDVNPVDSGQYVARAFFPGQERSTRNVLIDSSAFEVDEGSVFTLGGVLAHELGHALGFRHEHVRADPFDVPFQNWLGCLLEGFVDSNYRPVTEYDAASVMHYPQCGGTGDLTITALDIAGAQEIYGPPIAAE